MSGLYSIITDRIIEMLEKGVVAWKQPWVGGRFPVSWKSQKPYRGINLFLLPPGEYASAKQIFEAGGKIKKGSKANLCVFWKHYEKDVDGKKERSFLLRYYNVFEINTQVEGLESKQGHRSFEHDSVQACEDIIDGFMGGPEIRYGSGRAYYAPFMDYVSTPPMSDFPSVAEYYSVKFHELIHSTGHPERLNRFTVGAGNDIFGSESYSKEELVAEMGAAMLCHMAGIDDETMEMSASYIKCWIDRLKGDTRFIVSAAAQAQKAVDKIIGTVFESKQEEPDDAPAEGMPQQLGYAG